MQYNTHKHHNICLTIHSLAASGGEERMCVLLADALFQRGYNVIIVTLNQIDSEDNIYMHDKRIKQYSLRRNRYERKITGYLKFIPLLRYKCILKRHKVAVVIDVDIHQSLVTTKATKGTNIKVISWDHFNYERFKVRWSYDIMMGCFKSGEIDKLVVLTKADSKSYKEIEKFPESFITQIYNSSPVEHDEYIQHKEKKVLAVGRLVEQKGFDLLLTAWLIVEQFDDEWTLEIVGDGHMRQQLLEQKESLGLKRIKFTNYTNEIKEKYRTAGIFVLSSRYEGFGLVLVESESMSLPLVAFNCKEGPGEIIKNGYNGFLVEPENIKMLAEKLLELMTNDGLREQMSRNAFEDSKKYKMEKIIDKWENLIESL